MKIGIVANTTWNIYKFRLNVVEELLRQGFEVFVIAPVDEFLVYKEKYSSVRHVPIRFLHRNGLNPVKDLLLLAELYHKYQRLGLEAILHYTHKPNVFGSLAARLAGISSVSVITGLGYAFINPGITQVMVKMLYKVSARQCSELIFENQDDLAAFRRAGIIKTPKGKAVRGCGLDLQYFVPPTLLSPRKDLVFTFVGRLLIDKGIVEFVEAAKQLKQRYPRVRCWVIGDLDEGNPSTISKTRLAEWVNEGAIEYHGFVRDIRPLLSKTDCVVLPTYREGMPRSIMEAMAMAIPVIGTDVPGCREIVQDGKTGFLIPMKDVNELVQTMTHMINLLAEERRALGLQARQFAENSFDHVQIAREIVAILRQVVGIKAPIKLPKEIHSASRGI